jgi:hypothetical protein
MWMIELATKTNTAAIRIGIHSDITGTIAHSSRCARDTPALPNDLVAS